MNNERFATAISCIDGRFVTRTVDHLQTRFGVKNVDLITAAGAVRHLAGEIGPVGEGLLDNVSISIEAHDTNELALVAHAECAGNPVPDGTQRDQLRQAGALLREQFPALDLVTLFLEPKTGFERVG